MGACWFTMTEVAILISYRVGDPELLKICLDAIERHTCVDYEVIVMVDGGCPDFPMRSRVGFQLYDVHESLWGSQRHGDMLNVGTSRLRLHNAHKYLLTLDSDCIPIADGWLAELLDMMDDTVGCAGVLHPWTPMPPDTPKGTIEHRIRSGWNWNNTHVACQLTRLHYMDEHGLDYRNCDDTGLCVPMNAHHKHHKVRGWKPTRCAMPDDDFDAEFNRDVCVVFGDKVCHIGGGSREKESIIWPAQHFQGARQRIRDEGHARWILDEGYGYKFNQEEAVIEAKMKVMFALMRQHLKHNESLF
jgi:hypothetical protein